MSDNVTPIIKPPCELGEIPFDKWPDAPMKPGGRVAGTIENYIFMFSCYRITCAYDVIGKALRVSIPGMQVLAEDRENQWIAELTSLATRNNLSTVNLQAYVMTIAMRNPVNPALEWMESREWDGENRIRMLAATLTTASPEYLHSLLFRWLLSLAAAAVSPKPIMIKGVLVLAGPESIGKTTWFENLFAEVPELFEQGRSLDPDCKDSVMGAIENWCVELGELESTMKKDQSKLKAFITKTVDVLRRPYARAETKFQRRTVFCGSVNSRNFLKDDTDNVRYWIHDVTAINLDHGIDMQQVFAEALHYHKTGIQYWTTPEEELDIRRHNQGYREENSMADTLDDEYDTGSDESDWRWLTPGALLIELKHIKQNDRALLIETGKAMKAAIAAKYPHPADQSRYAKRPKNRPHYWWPKPKL
jgi:putative DNA primase/helicase